MARLIELNVPMGIQSDHFIAGDHLGGYAWARMGADFDLKAHDALRDIRSTSQKAALRLRTVQHLLPKEIYNYAKRLSAFQNAGDVSRLAAIDYVLTGVVTSEFYDKECRGFDILNSGLRGSGACSSSMAALQEANKIKKLISSCEENDIPLTAGKLCLIGSCWPARFDYTDDAQMKQVADYVGGFKFSEIRSDSPARRPGVLGKAPRIH